MYIVELNTHIGNVFLITVLSEERKTKMQRNISKQSLHARFCLLVLSITLFLAACGNGSGYPSTPSGTPQATPTKGGYSFIYHGREHTTRQQYHLHLGPGR
jgi:hypothetical protein